MAEDRFVIGERVYLPLNPDVTAPVGVVLKDDGGPMVVVAHMEPILGIGMLQDRWSRAVHVPRERLALDRRGRR